MANRISSYFYEPATRPVVREWIIPERQTLFEFRYRWPWIRILIVIGIILFSVLPTYGLLVTLILLGGYSLWHFVSDVIRLFDTRSQSVAIARHLCSLIVAFLLVETFGSPDAPLWLIYLVPVLTLGAELPRHWALPLITITACLAFRTAALGQPVSDSSWLIFVKGAFFQPIISGGLLRAILVVYIGLTSYIISRSLGYLYRLNERLAEALPIIANQTSWEDCARQAVLIASELIKERRGNVIANLLTTNGTELALTSSSSAGGQQLASSGFSFPVELGITGWVAQHGQDCFLNDINHDPEKRYMANRAFPDIKSEVAVPVMDGDSVIAVLDLESQRRFAFTIEDVNVLHLIAAHLSVAKRQTRSLQIHRQLAALSGKLARRVVSMQDLGILLREIGEVAIDVLSADQLDCYFKNPVTGDIWGPYDAGRLLVPTHQRHPHQISPESLITRLMADGRMRVFDDVPNELELNGRDPWHVTNNILPFATREQIASSVVIPLRVGDELVGIVFINYRKQMTFSPELMNLIDMVMPSMSLAVQNCLREDTESAKGRDRLARDLHDTVSHRLTLAEESMSALSRHEPSSAKWNESLLMARNSLASAKLIVHSLVYGSKLITWQSIIDELENLRVLIENIYGINVELEIQLRTTLAQSSIPKGGQRVLYSIEELLFNAVRHSQAKTIEIHLNITSDMLNIIVSDDGIGLDPRRVRPGSGLYNLRHTVEGLLGGQLGLNSKSGGGTRANISLPLPSQLE